MLKRSRPPKGVEAIPRPSRQTSPSDVPIRRLRMTVLRRIDGLLAGDYAGLFPGHGTEQGEARPYVAGDDPRRIDWAVTARTHEPYVRDTIADHELDVWLILDTSSSLGFGTGRSTKHEVAWSAAGAFALLAASGGNRIGAVRSAPDRPGRQPGMLPARSGSSHTGAVLAMLSHPPIDGEPGDLTGAIARAQATARRRGTAVVVSDFLGAPDWERPMRTLAHRHEVIAVEVTDPREVGLPDVGLISVVDPETGRRRLVDTASGRVRERYAALAARRSDETAARLRRTGADHLVLRTDRDWVVDFVRFVTERKARLLAAGRGRR